MLPILHYYRFQSNEELLKIPILTSKIFALPLAPPSQLVSDIHCGRGTLSGTLRLPRNLVHVSLPDGDFFSLRSKTFTTLKLRSLNRLRSALAPHPKDKIFDSLNGFFAHEYFKSRAILKKYHCSRKVLFEYCLNCGFCIPIRSKTV